TVNEKISYAEFCDIVGSLDVHKKMTIDSMSAEPDTIPSKPKAETPKEDTPFEAAQRIDEDEQPTMRGHGHRNWTKLVEDEEEPESEPNEVVKLSSLPVSKMKLIMKADPDTRLINKEAVLAVAKATELFIQQLGKAAHDFAVKANERLSRRRTLNWLLTGIRPIRRTQSEWSLASKVIDVNGRTVKLQVMLRAIWDTAGQERFKSVTRSYYRARAAGALLVYDVTSRDSYNALSNWLSDARSLASPNIAIVMIGNKRDLDADREVTLMEASQFAQQNCACFSWRLPPRLEKIRIRHCARAILSKIESGEVDPERLGSGVQFTAGSFSGRSRSLGGGGGGGTGDHGGGPLDN
uniref:CBFD_NFYB_HMF domain-containing protein n=1 Tax=Macrostomum lignano TaxID=282301 RepID=A0A1I8FFL7_9PLAT